MRLCLLSAVLVLHCAGAALAAEEPQETKGKLDEVTVPAQAIGPKVFTLDYGLQMEYDKQLAITGLPVQTK